MFVIKSEFEFPTVGLRDAVFLLFLLSSSFKLKLRAIVLYMDRTVPGPYRTWTVPYRTAPFWTSILVLETKKSFSLD